MGKRFYKLRHTGTALHFMELAKLYHELNEQIFSYLVIYKMRIFQSSKRIRKARSFCQQRV